MRDEKYFQWLRGLVNADDRDPLSFRHVCDILYGMNYYHTCKKDEKLLKYARDLREQYVEETECEYEGEDVPSVLEILIRISQYAEDITSGSKNEITTNEIFFEMLSNLGISYSDERYERGGLDYGSLIRRKVERWLDRSIGRNGSGSPFPLTSIKRWKNQRNEETWYQMQHYLEENYPI